MEEWWSGPEARHIDASTAVGYYSFLDPSMVVGRSLPGAAVVGQLLVPAQDAFPLRPETLAVNPAFVEFLHRVIAEYAPTLPEMQAEAMWQENGWIYLIDARTPTPQGEVPPEDILGAFEVRDEEIVPGSYQRSSKHRIVTERGLFRLHDVLFESLLWELERLVEE
jgi:hypothetical protein